MRKFLAHYVLLFTFLFAFLFTFSISAHGMKKAEHGGLAFEVIHPSTQLDTNVGYYDLRLKPGQKETATIKLHNSSNKEIKVSVKLNSAKTNSAGVIEYGEIDIPNDKSLKIPFESVVSAPEEVIIPSNSSVDLPIKIDIKDKYAGLIAGAIELEELDQEPLGDGDTAIINKFAYIIGMTISQTDYDSIQPDLILNSVKPGQNNFQNAMIVNFSNIAPVYFEDMSVSAKIVKEDSDNILYETNKNNMRMAPNSMINFPVLLNGNKMKAGNYEAQIVVRAKTGQEWVWNEPFTISADEAKKYNASDLTLVKNDKFGWKMIVLIILIILLVTAIVIGIIKYRKQQEKSNQTKNQKAMKRQRNRKKDK